MAHNLFPPHLRLSARAFFITARFLAAGHLVFVNVVSLGPASGPSMLPTFDVYGDSLLVSSLHRYGRGVSVGDLVVYKIPTDPDTDGVKRVLGMPGDYVSQGSPEGDVAGPMIQVPQGHCWLVGDNLPASRDSRIYGPVPLALVRGKAIARVQAPFRITWLKNPLQRVDSSTL